METKEKNELKIPEAKKTPAVSNRFASLRTVVNGKLVKRVVAVGLIGALVGGITWYALSPDEVDTAKVAVADVVQTVSVSGKIAADKGITVYAPIAGKVADVGYRVDDMVNAGDLLLQYDTASYEKNYRTASANTVYQKDGYNAAVEQNNRAQEEYDAAVTNAGAYHDQFVETGASVDALDVTSYGKEQEAKVDIHDYEKRVGTLSMELETANTNLNTAETAYDEAQTELTSMSGELTDYDKKIAAKKVDISTAKNATEKAEAEKALKTLEAERATVQSKYNNVKGKSDEYEKRKNDARASANSLKDSIEKVRNDIAGVDIRGLSKSDYERFVALKRQLEIIEKNWDQSLTEKVAAREKMLTQSQIAQQQDSVKIASIEEEDALKKLKQAKEGVVADVSGTVVKRYFDNGAYVEAGAPLYEIQPLNGYKATVMVSRFDIGYIQKGQPASVKVGNDVYEGTVSAIAQVADTDASGKPKVRVDISLDGSEHPIIGLEADVTIRTDEVKDALSVTEDAVYTDDKGDYVYLLNKEGILERRDIKCGITGDGQVQVMSGLKEGDDVVTSAVLPEDIGVRFVPAE